MSYCITPNQQFSDRHFARISPELQSKSGYAIISHHHRACFCPDEADTVLIVDTNAVLLSVYFDLICARRVLAVMA